MTILNEEDEDELLPAVREHGDAPIVPGIFKDEHHPAKTPLTDIDGETNKAILKEELENYSIYLHNIHRAFASATTVHALSRLINDGLKVNKQRRATIEHALKLKGETLVIPKFDAMGHPIKD